MDFYHLQENIKNKCWLDDSKKVVHKAGEFIGNKIADSVTKSNDDNNEKQEPAEWKYCFTRKKRANIK